MATISKSQTVTSSDGSIFSIVTELDTDSGKQFTTINDGSGGFVMDGTPDKVISRLATFAKTPKFTELSNASILVVENQKSALNAQFQQQVPTPNKEPLPPATENKTDPNNLTREADGDSGQSKEDQAKSNPNPSGNLNDVPEIVITADRPKPLPPGAADNQKPGLRPQNPLGSLSSYTYQLTLYMITPDAYDAFIQSGRNNINAINNAANPQVATEVENSMSGAYIIAQSGGINNKTSKRAFDYDFYIDDLKIKTKTAGPATGTASNDSEISFNIYEPYGFSFISKITNAAQILRNKSKLKQYNDLSNAGKQFFILGIRFQGYDENGKEISSATTYNQDKTDITGDSGGVYERFFDIKIKSFKFKLDGKMTVYNIMAAPIAPNTAYGVKFGRLDRGGRYQGSTVDQVLKNLVKQLNDYQQNKINSESPAGIIPNVYKIRYLGNAEADIGGASIVSVADVNKSTWPMSVAKNVNQVNEGISVTATPNSNSRTITFANDVSIMQAVSSIISQSSYLTDALNVVIKSTVQPPPTNKGGPDVPDPKPDAIKWYNLGAEVKCLGFDTIAGDFAYEITYIIQPYATPYVTSPYVNTTTKYYGPHKRYEYWFTGKNSEILNYEQKLDNAYFIAALNPTGAPASQGGGQDIPTIEGKRQNEDRTGKLDVGKEAQNSYLTSLFDPGAYATAKVTIMGDPDFLMQESPSSANQIYRQFYGKGFTINPNGGQVFIEIDFKEADDYNNDDGLLTINQSILFWKYPKEVASLVKGVSYQVIEVNSSFAKGKFTQDLECRINPMTDLISKESSDQVGRPPALDASGRRTGASDPRVTPIISAEDQALAANEVTRLATKYPVTTNSALNASSQPDDDGVINPTKQPANQGGREVNLTQANQALAARARDNATTNAQLRLFGRPRGGA
jgi:hypothetical protein